MVMNFNARSAAGAAALGCLLALAGCSSLPSGSVPVEDRSIYSDGARSESARPATLGSVRDSGRTHQVAYGDTLYNISARYGLDTRELAQLNGISDPTQLRLGQVLHLPESVTEPKPMTIASGVRISRLEAAEPAAKTTPAPAADAEQGSAPAEKTSLTNTPSEPSKEASASVQTTKPIQPAVPGTKLIWPARGPILSDFAKNGKDPKKIFKRVVASNHESNALAVANRQVDVATFNNEGMGRLEEIYPDKAAQLAVIWKSPLIPSDPLVWRKDLSDETKKKITDFIFSYGVSGKNVEKARQVLAKLQWGPFKKSDNSQLTPLHQLELFREKMSVEGNADMSDKEKAERIADIDARLAALGK